MSIDRIGHLVFGVIVKTNADQPGYLAVLAGTEKLGILPKRLAERDYKVQETFGAVIVNYRGVYPILSQRCPMYLRQVAERVFAPVIQSERVRVRGVATVQRARFVKIAVESLTDEDAVKACLRHVRDFHTFSVLTPCLVRYDPDVEIFIRNAFVPAPADDILRLQIYREERMATMWVRERSIRRFLGSGAMNVATASRLTGYDITLVGERDHSSVAI
jgi:hypothetical protein